MSGLSKRIDALEQVADEKAMVFLFVEYASDSGLVYDGKFYEDRHVLTHALRHDPDKTRVHVMGWQPGQTAAELLEEAAERAKNPKPEVTLADLGEYGRKLVEEERVTPAVAQFLENLKNERENICTQSKNTHIPA